jgi:hypothetical protein
MRCNRLVALIVAASLLSGSAASAGGPLRPFRYGLWSGGAYIDDRTGAFTHCSAGVAYDSGVNLFVLVTGSYRWWLGFIDPKWSLSTSTNAKIPIRLRLDHDGPFERSATVPNAQLLLVPLPDNSHLIDAFRRGSELALDVEGQTFFFKLNETQEVIDRLTGCVRTSLELDEAGATARQSKSITSADGSSADRQASAPLTPGSHSAQASAPSAQSEAGRPSPMPSLAGAPAHGAPPIPLSTGAKAAAAAAAAATQPAGPAAVPAETTEAAGPSTAPHRGVTEIAAPATSIRAAPPGSAATETLEATTPSGQPATPSAEQPSPFPTAPVSSSQFAALSSGAAEGPRSGSGGSLLPVIADRQPPATGRVEPGPQMTPGGSRAAPLAFTAVPAIGAAPPAPSAAYPPSPPIASGEALEEVRLASEFLVNAGLSSAHLVVSDKPPALANFAAVWRAEGAAGAVKIIPPAPDISAIAIASNLIAVDPQLCKGDFTAARVRTDVGNRAVFSAVLTCHEAGEERVTEYFIAPRRQGGFVVFAVIRSKGVDKLGDLDRRNLEGLSKAAIETAGGQG